MMHRFANKGLNRSGDIIVGHGPLDWRDRNEVVAMPQRGYENATVPSKAALQIIGDINA